MGLGGQSHAPAALPPGITQYPSYLFPVRLLNAFILAVVPRDCSQCHLILTQSCSVTAVITVFIILFACVVYITGSTVIKLQGIVSGQ